MPFLRTSREYPEDLRQLTVEVNKSYIETAYAVNNRTIGIFSLERQSLTGETWFIESSQRQQIVRQLYRFEAAGSFAHGFNMVDSSGIARLYGSFTNGTNWYPLPYVDIVSAANQINIIVTPTDIVITAGAGTPPAIVSGYVILEIVQPT